RGSKRAAPPPLGPLSIGSLHGRQAQILLRARDGTAPSRRSGRRQGEAADRRAEGEDRRGEAGRRRASRGSRDSVPRRVETALRSGRAGKGRSGVPDRPATDQRGPRARDRRDPERRKAPRPVLTADSKAPTPPPWPASSSPGPRTGSASPR